MADELRDCKRQVAGKTPDPTDAYDFEDQEVAQQFNNQAPVLLSESQQQSLPNFTGEISTANVQIHNANTIAENGNRTCTTRTVTSTATMALPTQMRQLGQLMPNQIIHRQESGDDTNSQQQHFQQYQSQPQVK